MKKLMLAFGCVLAVALPAAAQDADITGTWDLTIVTPQGGQPAPLTLRMDGGKLVGTIAGPQGELPVQASVKERAVSISFTVQTPNGAIAVAMTGTADGDAMKGAVDFGGRAQGEWSAKRTAAAAAPAPPPASAECCSAEAKVDVTGTWMFEVNTGAGTGTPTVTLKQEGEKLTGHYAGSYGEAPLTGTIKGAEIEFALDLNAQGNIVHVIYSGVVEKDTVKGTVKLGDLGDGTFTGKRK